MLCSLCPLLAQRGIWLALCECVQHLHRAYPTKVCLPAHAARVPFVGRLRRCPGKPAMSIGRYVPSSPVAL